MKNGFTLLELMIVLALVGIVIAVAFPLLRGNIDITENSSWGVNGVVEQRCVGGYNFIIGQRGQPTQIIDDKGHGVPCGGTK